MSEREGKLTEARRKPLNGEKTHPLSQHALAVLLSINRRPMPRSDCNPGVVDRLTREDLVEITDLPSPFKTHNGKQISHLRITEAGRAALKKAGG